MPLYEFKCKNCESIQEELVSYSVVDTVTVQCDQCGSTNTKRIMSRPNGRVANTNTPTKS